MADPFVKKQGGQELQVRFIFLAKRLRRDNPSIEEVGPASVFDAAFDGERSADARHPQVSGNRAGTAPC